MITKRITIFLYFFFNVFTPSCKIHKNETIILSKEISNNPLNIEFKSFVVHGLTINECLMKITEAVKAQAPGQPVFLWSTRFYGTDMYNPEPQPKVHITFRNARMKNIFDEICKQTGWIYTKVPYGFAFEKPSKSSDAAMQNQ